MTMKRDTAERRKQRFLERLGTPNFVCITCGGTDWCTAEGQSRLRKSAQDDKWSFCLIAGTLCPANQEKQ
jgi:hypothetical protein